MKSKNKSTRKKDLPPSLIVMLAIFEYTLVKVTSQQNNDHTLCFYGFK